jgi:hypothetical protein
MYEDPEPISDEEEVRLDRADARAEASDRRRGTTYKPDPEHDAEVARHCEQARTYRLTQLPHDRAIALNYKPSR